MGRSKAEVAAQRIEERVRGVTVTPHYCRVEHKPLDFYEQFHIIVLGLDSLEARQYMNQVACSFLGAGPGPASCPWAMCCCIRLLSRVCCSASHSRRHNCEQLAVCLSGCLPVQGGGSAEYDADGEPDLATIKPIIDGGTEGMKGNARVILPGKTACFECTLWLFPPQTKFPLCTLAETPRCPPLLCNACCA